MARLLPYAVISPVKDEAEWLPQTIASIVAQQHRPDRWVIVDDGSSDSTAAIADGAALEHPWITVVRQRDGGAARARGAPIVRAFNAGLAVAGSGHSFVVKLDGDLFLPSHYFAWIAEIFERLPAVGIAGGRAWVFRQGAWREDAVAAHNVHGAFKAYRTECLAAIGGLQPSMGWDGIDELAARARGWEVRVAPELQVLHYKMRGSRQRWWKARWEEGLGMRFMGYRLEFVLLRSAFRAVWERPRVLSGLAMLAGFATATLRGDPVVPDLIAVKALRDEQRARIMSAIRLHHPLKAADGSDGPAFWSIPRPPREPTQPPD